MSTPAQLAAGIANAKLSCGPRTEEGKAISSRNAISHGLFAKRDFIRPGEEHDYAQAKADLDESLAPAGPLERNLADEIRRAIWRLRRCGQIEASFVDSAPTAAGIPDPMQNEATARLQNSVDRARSQAHRLLHKCTAELRRLQTERQFRNHAFEAGTDISALGICDYRAIQKGLDNEIAARLRKRRLDEAEQFDAMCAVTTQRAENLLTKDLLTKQTPEAAPQSAPIAPQTARNAPCPCKSGEKYKRCCGKSAPPVLHAA